MTLREQGTWRADAWLRSTLATLRWLRREVGHLAVMSLADPAATVYRRCKDCGTDVTKPKARYCPDCRAKRDAEAKRRSKRAKAVVELPELPKVVIADDSCCGQYALERRRLFAKLGREEAIRRAPWLVNARCPQCVTYAQIQREQRPKPRVLLTDEDWFDMGFHIVTHSRAA